MGKGVRLVFLSAAGAPLVSFLFLSAAGASAGSEAFVAGRSLWTFSAESYAQQVFEHSRPAQLRGSWCSGITPAQHARGAGFNPRPVHAHVRLRLSQFASPWSFIPLGLLCVLPRPLVRRGRVPNVTFESYIESRKLSVPRARPARTASRPARLEAALASPQQARTKGVRRQPAPPRPGASRRV